MLHIIPAGLVSNCPDDDLSVLLHVTDDISIVGITPLFGPVAGGTNISVTLKCPQSDCGDVKLYIGDYSCLQIYHTRYVYYSHKQ